MAAAVYATDLVDINLVNVAGSTTNWTALGGGASGLVAETDFFIQGDGCMSKAGWSAATKGMIYSAGSQSITTPAALFIWLYFWGPNALDTEANGGLQVLIGSGTAAFKQWYVRGSNTYAYGGWVCVPVDPSVTADATTGSPTATLSFFGGQAKITGAITKGQPFGIDAFRYGREIRATNGDLANGYATFAGLASTNDTNRWGQFQAIDGGYLMQGLCVLGLAGTTVDFRDSNRNISIANTKKVVASFNGFEVRNASSNIALTNIVVSALGAVSRGNWTTTDNATIALTTCTFTDMGTFGFKSNSTLTTSTFRRCNLVTQSGSTISGCIFDSTNDATRAVLSDNPTKISGCTFISSGTKHAVEATTPGTYNWVNNTATGYATVDGSTGNETFYNNSGGAITLNITGSTPTIRNGSGATTTIVAGTVTTTITVTDINTAAAISGARVLVTAADNAGPMPYQESVTITRSGTTATVSHTAHGLVDGKQVLIKGANQPEYNGVFTIAVVNTNSYTYTVSGSPATPATGTPVATGVVIYGSTNGSGVISDTRTHSSNQNITGRVRSSTSGTLYKTGAITGTISSTTGFAVAVQMISDQ